MAWRKSPEWLVEAFGEIVPEEDPRVERRKMFGYPCAFANDNMFIGLHQENMLIRLPEGDRERFLEQYDSEIFQPFPGRVMREYVVVPHDLVRDPKALEPWIRRSLEYAASIPSKKKGTKKKAAPKTPQKVAATKRRTPGGRS
ncbi:MAG TPA: TfoX/Sxy family protein [Thermoanaerobaculia bacterium]|nr:TfoX/Sxy family protein [Thermoanaerobaculia bacterium]